MRHVTYSVYKRKSVFIKLNFKIHRAIIDLQRHGGVVFNHSIVKTLFL